MLLDVPALPCVIRAGVFDAWGWIESDVLEWRRPISRATSDGARALSLDDRSSPGHERLIGGENPPGLVFVLRDGARARELSLPSELARLHAFGYGLEDELALAPYGIDDATDRLYEQRARPRDVFWLAASSLEALVWGLHDWAHFHNHGPFEEPAMTELQCDLVALAWLRGNAARLQIGDGELARVAGDLAALARARFAEEGAPSPADDLDALFASPYPTRVLG